MTDVRSFGAAGDGVQDDTEALRHAIREGDGPLELSPGTYRISQPLEIPLAETGYRAIVGQGGTARLVMSGAGPALRIIGTHQGTADPPSVQPPVWKRQRMPLVQDLEIVGDHPEANGIELIRTMQATLTGVLIRQVNHGIRLAERNRNFLLSGCHIYDNRGVGLLLDRCNLHQAIITGCHISYNRTAGIQSVAGDLHNMQITGNDIEYNYDHLENSPGGAEIWFDAREGVASEITIASNTIQARPSPGGVNLCVWGEPDAEVHSARLITVTGNVLGSQSTNIEIRDAERVSITGNTIYDGREQGVLLQRCHQVVLGSNTFGWSFGLQRQMTDSILARDCHSVNLHGLVLNNAAYGTAEAGGGITLERCHDSAISACQIQAAHHRGIHLLDCQRCRVSDNSVTDSRSEPTPIGIELSGGSQNLVQGNLIVGPKVPLRVAEHAATLQGNVTDSGGK